MIIKSPQGPIRPLIEALEENEILNGWVTQLEDSAKHQMKQLEEGGCETLEEGGRIYHGLDGTTWALEQLFSDYFPSLQRAAAFLAIWGSFERHIYELCRQVALAGSYRLKVGDLAGKGLTRARRYLLKVAGLDGEWANARWQEFPCFQHVRNIFAHGDGHIDLGQAKQEACVAASPHVTVQNGIVQLEPGFLPHVLQQQRRFLNGLEEVVVQRFGHGV